MGKYQERAATALKERIKGYEEAVRAHPPTAYRKPGSQNRKKGAWRGNTRRR